MQHETTTIVNFQEPALRRRNRALSALLDMSRFLSSTIDPEQLLEEALDKVIAVSGFEAGRIYFKEKDGPYLALAAHRGMEPQGLEKIHVNEGFSGKSFRSRSVITRNVLDLEDKNRAALLAGKGFKTVVCVPLILADRVGGVMNLATGKKVRVTAQEVDFLTALGNQIAVGVNHARLYQDLNRQLRVLREKKEMIKFFAYSVSHDLKSPAVGIHGLARRFQERYSHALDERGRAYCDQILKAAEHMVALVDKINAYISARESRLSIEKVDVADLLSCIRDEFSEVLEERGIRWYQPDHPVMVDADRIALSRVFRNLLDNAIKYGGNGLDEIRIEYAETDKEQVFLFKDNGAGIPQKARESVFKLFHRETASCGGADGSGLGLAIVKEIAERHGGGVSVESVPAGGAAFRLTLSKSLPKPDRESPSPIRSPQEKPMNQTMLTTAHEDQ